MEEQTIIAKGKPTLKNALQFLMYSVGLVLLMGIVSIYVLVTLYYITTMYGDQRAILMLSLQKAIVPTILLFLLYFLVIIFREYRVLKKRRLPNEETIFIINKEGISTQNGNIKEIVGWINILKVKEYKDIFLFRHSSIKWSFLPKHFFQTEEDLALFKKMIQEYHTNRSAENSTQPNLGVKDIHFPSEDIQGSNIIAKGNFTFKEYDQYASVFRNKMLLLYIISALVLLGLIFRNTFFSASLRWNWSTVLLALIFLVMIALGTMLVYFLFKHRARKEYKSDPASNKEKLYVINEEGIVYSIEGSSAQYRWKDFRKVQEYKDMLIFYVAPQRAILIPIRLFESSEDVEKVKELTQENVDSKSIKFED
ncbi:hypothetical protein GLO26_06100 [Carnobacterium inhibens]|uniref:YcxB-like C-terminal domain-containing protein n=2 Tax=Carnobacterium inhibens TaxID=147709 RepID=A0ABR7TD66_9LACT|nr:hypothetical protein [Carnobacterium inhibens]